MADDQKEDVDGPAPQPSGSTRVLNECVPTRRHPLFGALKGYIQVTPGTDLTKAADPAWEEYNT